MAIENCKKFKKFVEENKEPCIRRLKQESRLQQEQKDKQEVSHNIKDKKDFLLSEKDIEDLSKEVGAVNPGIKINFTGSPLSDKDYEDIYQESVIALYNYIGRKIECKFNTFFYNICYRQTLKLLRSKNKIKIIDYSDTSSEVDHSSSHEVEKKYVISIHKVNQILQVKASGRGMPQQIPQPDKTFDLNLMKDLVHKALDNMAEKCRQLLTKYYIDGDNWTKIAIEYELKDALSAKANAYRCRKRFEEKYKGLRNFVKSNKKHNA